jgi:outer membrane lipoprotein SlyB
MLRYSLVALMVFLLGACSTSTSSTYNANDVGSVIETTEATVLTSRVVKIEGGENSGTGTVAGGAVGATTGYVLAGKGSGRGLGVVLGAVVGAATGYLIEESAHSREGIEYVVRMNDGRVVTLVQNREEGEVPLPDGAPVLVQYGNEYTRIIERPDTIEAAGAGGGGGGTASGGAGAGGWTNPDAVQGEQAYPVTGTVPSSTYDSNYTQ